MSIHPFSARAAVRIALHTVAAACTIGFVCHQAEARIIHVRTTIQAAVDKALPGDKVRVPAGTYHESVAVGKDDITIQGERSAILDGSGLADATGITVGSGSGETPIRNFQLKGLTIQNFASGVAFDHADVPWIRGTRLAANLDYGIRLKHCTAVRIWFVDVSDSRKAGI